MTSIPTIYTSPYCNKCKKTIGEYERRHRPVRTIDVEQTPGALHALTAMGFTQLPVVITDEDKWSGHRLDKILADIGKGNRDAS